MGQIVEAVDEPKPPSTAVIHKAGQLVVQRGVVDDIRQSSHDLKDILQKINSSRGTAGLMTRDFFRYLVRRPFEGRLLLDQLDAVGVQSVNVVNLTAIFSGMVLALQSPWNMRSSAR